jgi:beta-glucosidase
MKKHSIGLLLLSGAFIAYGAMTTGCSPKKSYLDTSLSPAERASLILKEMTLEEKVGQMCQYVGPSISRKTKENKITTACQCPT